MKYLVSILVLLCAASGFAAIGDVDWFTVETNGWALKFGVNSYLTATTNTSVWNFGFLTNNTGPSKVILTVSNPGFDDSGISNWTSKIIYGTHQIRKAFPNNTNADTSVIGSDLIGLISLSEYVASNDVVSAVWSSGFYSNNSAGSANTITNLSTAGYSQMKCIANWSWPGWQLITSNNMVLRAVGYHRSGQLGRPLRVMRFVARDQHSHAVTNFITSMIIDSSILDAVPVCEYVAVMDISSFTQSDFIRCDFTAYPWQGDSGSVLDTMDNVNSQPTPFYASITNVCNRLGTYSTATAVVDPGGSDVNGRVSTNTDPTTINSAQYFLTIAKAANQISASNNVAGSPTHNDCGGGNIYLKSGMYNFAGASSTYGAATSPAWLTIQPYPGVARSSIIIGNNVGDRTLGNSKIHLLGITLTNNSALEFLSVPYIWVDSNYLNQQQATTFDGTEYEYYTDNLWTNAVGGFSYVAGQVKVPILIRGNFVTNSALGSAGVGMFSYTVLGNKVDYSGVSSPSTVFSLDAQSPPIPISTNGIIAYNRVTALNAAIPILNLGQYSNNNNGCAIIQNQFEKISIVQSQPIFQVAGNGANDSVTNWNNVLIWYLTAEGDRWNCAYDASGTSNHNRFFWSVKKSITCGSYNIKTDTYAGFDVASGVRIGNWPILYAVGFDGNGMTAITGFVSSGSFYNEFSGLNSTLPNTPVLSSLQAEGFWQYIFPKAFDGTTTGTGNGYYRFRQSSPAYAPQFGSWQGLPFDIEGHARSVKDPPGAYSYNPNTILTSGQTTILKAGTTTQLQP